MFAQKNNGIFNLLAALFPTGKNPLPFKKITANLTGFPIHTHFREVLSRIQGDFSEQFPSGSPQREPLIHISPGFRQVVAQLSEHFSQSPATRSTTTPTPLPELMVVVQQPDQTTTYRLTGVVRQNAAHHRSAQSTGENGHIGQEANVRAHRDFPAGLAADAPVTDRENTIFASTQTLALPDSPVPLTLLLSPAPVTATPPGEVNFSDKATPPPAVLTIQLTTPAGENIQLIFSAATAPPAPENPENPVIQSSTQTSPGGEEANRLFVPANRGREVFQEPLPGTPSRADGWLTNESGETTSSPVAANQTDPGIPISTKASRIHPMETSGKGQPMPAMFQKTTEQPMPGIGTSLSQSRSSSQPTQHQPMTQPMAQEIGGENPTLQHPGTGGGVNTSPTVRWISGTPTQPAFVRQGIPPSSHPGLPAEFPSAETTSPQIPGEHLRRGSQPRQVQTLSSTSYSPLPVEGQLASAENTGETAPAFSRSAPPASREPIRLARSVFDLFAQAQTENRSSAPSGNPVFKTPMQPVEEVHQFGQSGTTFPTLNTSEGINPPFTSRIQFTREGTTLVFPNEQPGEFSSPNPAPNPGVVRQAENATPAPLAGTRTVFTTGPGEPESQRWANAGKQPNLPFTNQNSSPGGEITETFRPPVQAVPDLESAVLPENEPMPAANHPAQETFSGVQKSVPSSPPQPQVLILTAEEWEAITTVRPKSSYSPQQPKQPLTRSQSVQPEQSFTEMPLPNRWQVANRPTDASPQPVQTGGASEEPIIVPETHSAGTFTRETVVPSTEQSKKPSSPPISFGESHQSAFRPGESGQPVEEKTTTSPPQKTNPPANQATAPERPSAEIFTHREPFPKSGAIHTNLSGEVQVEMPGNPTSTESPAPVAESPEPSAETGEQVQESTSPIRKEKETAPLSKSSVSATHAPIHRPPHRVAPTAPRPTSGGAATQPMETISRIARAFRLALSNHGQEILMELKPETLGLVKIQLKMQDDKLSGKVEVTSPEVHRLVIQHLPELTQKLQDMHIKVEHVEVQVMHQQAENQAHQQTGQNRGSHPLAHSRSVTPDQADTTDKKMPNKLKFHYSTFEYVA